MLPRTREDPVADPDCNTSCLYSGSMPWMMYGATGVLSGLGFYVESLLSLSKRVTEQTPGF